ncbi:Tetratricopeptide repeat [Plasmodiophora brassicae]
MSKDDIERALRLLDQDKPSDAIAVFDEILSRSSNDIQCIMGRASAYRSLKEYKRAYADLTKVLSLDPKCIEAYRVRALILNKTDDHAKANDDLTALLQLSPYDSDALHFRGITWAKLGDYLSAVDDLTAAIQIESHSSEMFRSRGLAYGHLKKYALALADFNCAIALDPQDPYPAYRDRGCIHVHLKNYQAAISDLTKAIHGRPDDVEAYHNRALAYYSVGQYENCIADSLFVLKHDPVDADACLDIAKANFKLNRVSDAIPFLIDAVVARPSHAPAVKKLLQKLVCNEATIVQSRSASVAMIHNEESRTSNSTGSDVQAEEPKVVDDDDSEHKRKTILKQMMASKRLAEFRRLNHDKDDLKKKIEERHAISTAEVDRRADQAIRIKREIEEQFLKTQKERDDLKQDVDAAIEQWVRAHKIGSGGDPFRVLVCALPKLLTSRQFVDLVPICSAFAHDPFPRAKAYRDVARFIHPDKIAASVSARDRELVNAAWCILSDAYSQ